MGQKASESAPVALNLAGVKSARGNVTIRNGNASAVEGFLAVVAVVYHHDLMRRRDLS